MTWAIFLLSTGPMIERDRLAKVQAENARLITLLEDHGIKWRLPSDPATAEPAPTVSAPEPSRFSTTDKVALFRRLFRGRTDLYPIRWESKTSGKSGYAPACGNEWRAGVCEKPRIKCGECNHRLLLPLSDTVIFFFTGSVSARDARRLGTAIISHTCARTHQLKLESYDRLFPNQDAMPKGGFGNLIALPLQKHPRENGCSVFVDADLRPYRDQWAFLAAVVPMPAHDIEPTLLRATGDGQRAPARCHLHRRGRSQGTLEALRIQHQKVGRTDAEVAHVDVVQPDLFREGIPAAVTGQ